MRTLSDVASMALKAPSFPSEPNLCSMWVRLVTDEFYGKDAFRHLFGASARISAMRFKKSPYAVPLKRGSKPDDILFRFGGNNGFGHVGIRIPGNRVAENSSVHVGEDDDEARGIRSLSHFGDWDLTVRLPTLEEWLASGKKAWKPL